MSDIGRNGHLFEEMNKQRTSKVLRIKQWGKSMDKKYPILVDLITLTSIGVLIAAFLVITP